MDVNQFISELVGEANIPVAKNVNTSVNQTPQKQLSVQEKIAALKLQGFTEEQAVLAVAAGVCQTPQTSAPAAISLQLNQSAQRPELKQFIRDDPQMGKVMRAAYYKSKEGYEGYKFYMKPISAFQKEPFGGGWSPNEAQWVEAFFKLPESERAPILADLEAFNRNPAIAATSRIGKKVAKGILKLE